MYLIPSVILFFAFFLWKYTYWIKRGVTGPLPIPPLGLFWNAAFTGEFNILLGFNRLYDKFKQSKFFGTYVFSTPILCVTDPDLIYKILGPDLDYWNSHGLDVDLENDPFNAHLFAASEDYWKSLRNKLNPSFTPGRIKMSFPIMDECSEKLLKYLKNRTDRVFSLNVKDTMFRYTVDVIGNAAFGFTCESFDNKKSPFLHFSKRIVENTFLDVLKSMLFFMFPVVAKVGITQTKSDVKEFFKTVTEEAVKYREDNKINRNDFLDALIELKNSTIRDKNGKVSVDGKNGSVSDIELNAQVYVFFFAGFETSASTTSIALRMLAKHPEIQTKARKEIKEVLEKHDGKLTYESISEIEILSNILNETMRLFPVFPSLFRKCTKDYIIPGTDVEIEKGTLLFLPIYAMQRDPEYFENPNQFDPDRFLPERKPKHLPKTFLTYGRGPRACIGIRFGLLQAKLALVKILLNFEVSYPEGMKDTEIQYDKTSTVLFPADGIHLRFEDIPREN